MFVTLNFSALHFLIRNMKKNQNYKKNLSFFTLFCAYPKTRNIVQYEHIDMNCRKAMTESMR